MELYQELFKEQRFLVTRGDQLPSAGRNFRALSYPFKACAPTLPQQRIRLAAKSARQQLESQQETPRSAQQEN